MRSVTDTAPPLCPQRGETALHMAARAGQAEVVRCLLRNGALVDARARVGAAPAGPRVPSPAAEEPWPGCGKAARGLSERVLGHSLPSGEEMAECARGDDPDVRSVAVWKRAPFGV